MQKQILAVAFVFLLLAPLVSHAQQQFIEEETINIGQENSDKYSNITNIVEDNISNEDTWIYRPPGRLLCGLLPESELNFTFTAPAVYNFYMVSKIRFSSQDIISGSSFMIVRTPILNGTYIKDGEVFFLIWEVTNQSLYNESLYNLSFYPFPDQRLIWHGSTNLLDLDSFSEEGNSFFRLDDRIYFYVHAPILPNHLYILEIHFTVMPEQNVHFFVTQDDIAQDNLRETLIYTYYNDPGNPSVIQENYFNLSIDLGWSFLIRDTTTLAGLATYQTVIGAGDGYRFTRFLPETYRNATSVYQNIMIPFISKEQVPVTITVKNYDLSYNIISQWSVDTSARDFFLVHSPTKVSTGYYYTVEIYMKVAINITFFLLVPSMPSSIKQMYLENSERIDDVGNTMHRIFFITYASYSQSTDLVWEQINYTSYLKLLAQKTKKQKTTAFQRIWTTIKDLRGIRDVINFITSGISAGSQYARNLFQNTIWQKIIDIKDIILDMLQPIFNDLFSKLAEFGKFIKKWGMKIYKVIKYIIKKLVYFGSVILGILMLLVEIIVFLILIGIPGIVIYFTYLIANGELNKVLTIINTIIHGYKWTKDNIKWW